MMNWFKLYFALLPVLFFCTVAPAQKITFGQNGMIDYDSRRGTFDVSIAGKKILKEGYAEALVNGRLISSKDFSARTWSKKSFNKEKGAGLLYRISSRNEAGITFTQLIYTYHNSNYFAIELAISGKALKTNQVFPMKGELVGTLDFRTYRKLFIPFDNDTFISYEANLLHLSTKNTSAEVTSIYDNGSRKGFVMGTLDHSKWKTGISTTLVNPQSLVFRVECGYTSYELTRDQIKHGYLSGTTVASAKLFFGYFDDWRSGMEIYAKAVRANDPPVVAKWTGSTPVGWNSWGVMQEKLSYDRVIRVVDYFAEQLQHFRMGETCYIDLDSYWDNMASGDDYTKLKQFASYCKSKGLKPGIYWAPFTDWGFTGGAGRKAPGSNYTFGDMWTKVGTGYHDFDGARALDPTHPGTQKRINYVIGKLKSCGFEMIKIDFLGHAAAESTNFYNPDISTGMQAYRSGMEYLLKCIDDKMLIYAAISPNMATGRYVQVRRIACDAFKTLKDTEYTLNSLTNGWWQTFLYDYIDADHVVLGNETEAVNISRTLSAIVTGTLITGDDFSADGPWKGRAKVLFQNRELLNVISDGKAFRPVEGDRGSSAAEQFIKASGTTRYLALFNFKDQPATALIDFLRLDFPLSAVASVADVLGGKTIGTTDFTQFKLPPSGAVLLKITLK